MKLVQHTIAFAALVATALSASAQSTVITKASGSIGSCDTASGLGVPNQNCSVSTGSMSITVQAPPSPRYIGFVGLNPAGLRAPTVKGVANTLPTNKNLRGESGVSIPFCLYDTGNGNVLFQTINADTSRGEFTIKSNVSQTDLPVKVGFRLPKSNTLSGYGASTFAQTIPSGTLPTSAAGCGDLNYVYLDVGLPSTGLPQRGEGYELRVDLLATPL